jgi:hypothetical protein
MFPHQNPEYTPPLPPYMLRAPPISFFSIWSPKQYWVNTNHESPHYVDFYPVTSSLLGPDILLSNLFSNTLSLHLSLNVNNRVSHPYKTVGKIVVLYIYIFDSNLEDKILHWILASIPWLQSALTCFL